MRIRSIKPDFFRHGGLQDLEAENPGQHVMLVYAGLWGLCDNQGVFPCEARRLKLDVLPFLDFSMEKTIGLLEGAGFLVRYKAEDGKVYGYIPSFCAHQRITGKEAIEGKKYPMPVEAAEKQPRTTEQTRGNVGETTGKHTDAQEGKGREKEREGSVEGETPTPGKQQDDFSFLVKVEYEPEVTFQADPPSWAEVAYEMQVFFTTDPSGIAQWEMMEASAGGRADPLRVCSAWAGKAGPIDLLNWRKRVGKLVTWVQTDVRTRANDKNQNTNGHLINQGSFERAVAVALAAD